MLHRYRPSPFWTLQAGGWLAFGAAMSIGRIGELPLPLIVAYEWPLAALGFVATFGLHLAYRHVPVGEREIGRMLLVSLLGSYLGSVFWTAAFHLYLRTLAAPLHAALSGAPSDLYYDGPLLDNTVFNTFTLLAWSVLYFGLQSYHVVREARERALRAEAQAHRAQLRALRYQLNPHFLFNAMNAISTLVGEGRNAEARGTIARLSDFLRLTLEGNDAPQIALAEEVEFVRRYLEIEQIRFGERLRVRIDVADEVLSAEVPALILQPLVENAIKHAVSPREEGACVTIEARRSHGDLLLRVADDGPGLAGRSAAGGSGIGLANTRERLRELFGAEHALRLETPEGGGLRVEIRIPLRPSARRDDRALAVVSR